MPLKYTILVVDDNESIINIVSMILVSAGYEVITDTKADLNFMRTGIFPDLVLLDNQLEEKSGADICRQLKAGERTKNIPVIMVSATENIDRIACEVCADDFLPKPFGIQQLLKKVENILTKRSLIIR